MDFRVKPQYVTPYTPWGVKLMPRKSFVKPRQSTLQWNSSSLIRDVISGRKVMLLHPLGHIRTEIRSSGMWFVPIEILYDIWKKEETHSFESFEWLWSKTELMHMPHWVIQKLIEWHFDVYGLIGQGLAEPIKL